MNFIQDMHNKKKELAPNISKRKAALQNSNAEHFSVTKTKKGYYFWRHIDPETGKRTGISKKDRKKAESLAVKVYSQYKAKYDIKLYNAICAFEEVYVKNTKEPREFLKDNPGLEELVLPQIITMEQKWQTWASEPYESLAGHTENLKEKTLKGHLVRSKSECFISDGLYRNGIPYRYEWTDNYADKLLSPDFYCIHPRTGKPIIWEHAGLMDDPDYINTLVWKISIYAKAGFILGENLIITSETLEHPMDSDRVQHIIDNFFK